MNKRRKLLITLGAGALVAPLASFAQQPAKIPRIGFLGQGPAEGFYTDLLQAFRAGLRELGYVEGKTLVIEYRYAEDKQERLAGLAAELISSKVDVIVAHGTPGTLAAKQATSTIPIVMTGVGDPVGAGLIASLARPGGNVTGFTNMDVDLAAKRLELLKDLMPKLARAAVLRVPGSRSSELQFDVTQAAARTLGIELQLFDARDAKEIESAFSAMAKARVGALTVLANPLILSQQKLIANLAMKGRLPSVFARSENVEAGGLMSYGPSLADLFRQAATHVGRILKGAKPADLPVEQPTRFEFVINRKTAQQMRLTIPPMLLARADRVIE